MCAKRESMKVIAGGFKTPEEVEEAEKKVEETSKKLLSRCSPTRSSVEAERDMLRDKVKLLEETILPAYKASAAQSSLALTQTIDDLVEDKNVQMNPNVKQSAGLANLPNHVNNSTEQFFSSEKTQPRSKKPRVAGVTATEQPKVTLSIEDDEVKRRTGFPTLAALLTYIFIVCNGDINLIMRRDSSLTWFEEWFLHFEYKWGRTLPRLWDAEKVYGPNRQYLRKVVSAKYNIERRARNSWPVYVSYEEDRKFRNSSKWDHKYPDKRVVMWDMTNIEACGFSDPDLQRLTYSKYY